MKPMRILLVGIGGYAVVYVDALAKGAAAHNAVVAGIVDPYAEKSPKYELARTLTSAFYNSVEEFFADNEADLAIIGTPIPLHAPQAIFCMEHGAHVLTEKPIAGTLGDAQRMTEVRDRTGRILAVGFQWCYDPAMLAFRRDAQAGLFGELLSAKGLVLWPRDTAYYTRTSGWAGKKYDKAGNPIFDSVASNATAHYLENILWITGREVTDIQAVTARANPIETYDTIALTARAGRTELFYTASHAAGRDNTVNPVFEYVFEKGVASYRGLGYDGCELIVRLNDGTEKNYGITRSNTDNHSCPKLWSVVDSIRTGAPLCCSAEDAMLHTRVLEAVHTMIPESYVFPADQVRNDEGMYWVPGLAETLKKCFEERTLPTL